jgi:hypothetical protein
VVGGQIALQLLLTYISIIGSSEGPRCSYRAFLLVLIPSGFACGSAGWPLINTTGLSEFIPVSEASAFWASFSLMGSSSSSSSSLLSSCATLLKTKFLAILRIRKSQNKFTACRQAKRENVMYWLIQHLYCWVSQLSSKGPTVRNSVRVAQRILRLMKCRR